MLDYKNKLILAPMVRVSTLPIRLLSLKYGADIVFSEEIIDYKIIESCRHVNDKLGTIDYINKDENTVVFRTCPEEKPSLVFQLGTSHPERALLAAKKVEQDISAIDVNMGCPKTFSVKGGMGAALLDNPDLAESILRSLVQGLSIPVSCKIRSLGSVQATYDFCKRMQMTGIRSITVHGRRHFDRPRKPNDNQLIRQIASWIESDCKFTIIANGDSENIQCRQDMHRFASVCNVSSVMVARAALQNLSVFSHHPLPHRTVLEHIIDLYVRYESPFTHVKYTLQRMLMREGFKYLDTDTSHRFLQCRTVDEIRDLFLCNKSIADNTLHLAEKGTQNDIYSDEDEGGFMLCSRKPFIRGCFTSETLPKNVLHNWCRRRGLPVKYSMQLDRKLFRAICFLDDRRYASYWEKNKRFAEQGAAYTCITALQIPSCE